MADWETDSILFDLNDTFKMPQVAFAVDITTGNKLYVPAGANTQIDTIVFNANTDSVHFYTTLLNTQAGFTTKADWINVENKTQLSPLNPSTFYTWYVVRAAANTTGKAREELVHFYNPTSPTLRRSICFMQGIYTSPISVLPKGMPDWTVYKDMPMINWADAQTICPTGYRLPTVDEYLTILPPDGVAGNWSTAGTTTTIAESVYMTTETGPGYYIAGEDTYTLYGIKKAGTADAYVLEWIWVAGAAPTGKLTIRVMTVGADFGTSATAAAIKAKLDTGESAVTTLTFPNTGTASASYWTSTQGNAVNSWIMYVYASSARLAASSKGNNLGVRCIVN